MEWQLVETHAEFLQVKQKPEPLCTPQIPHGYPGTNPRHLWWEQTTALDMESSSATYVYVSLALRDTYSVPWQKKYTFFLLCNF